VILIHGLGGSRRTWRHLIGPLSRHYTVIALDLPGHGDSEASAGGYSPGAHAATIRDLMVGLGLSRASLVGHSLGGGIAVQFAYQFPERTDRLGLISSAGFGADVTPLLRAAILPGAERLLWGLGHMPEFVTRPALTAIAAIAGVGSTGDAGPLSEDLRGMSDPRRRRGFLGSARAGLDRHGQSLSAAPFLGRLVGLPVLLAWGTGDKIIPPRQHHELARSLPKGHVVEIVDAGHYPHNTEPAQVLRPLLAFLRGTPAFDYDDTAGTTSSLADRAFCARIPGLVDVPA
jgi:pimeloyl-ACP methyl ester carboxylesterase